MLNILRTGAESGVKGRNFTSGFWGLLKGAMEPLKAESGEAASGALRESARPFVQSPEDFAAQDRLMDVYRDRARFEGSRRRVCAGSPFRNVERHADDMGLRR